MKLAHFSKQIKLIFENKLFVIHPLLRRASVIRWGEVQFSSVAQGVRLFVTPWTAACQASLSFTISQSLLKFMFIESVMPSNHLILCHPFLLPSVFPSIRVFSNGSALCIRGPTYCCFNFSISPSNKYSRLISFRIDRFNLLSVQGLSRALSSTSVQKLQRSLLQRSIEDIESISIVLGTQQMFSKVILNEKTFLKWSLHQPFCYSFLLDFNKFCIYLS